MPETSEQTRTSPGTRRRSKTLRSHRARGSRTRRSRRRRIGSAGIRRGNGGPPADDEVHSRYGRRPERVGQPALCATSGARTRQDLRQIPSPAVVHEQIELDATACPPSRERTEHNGEGRRPGVAEDQQRSAGGDRPLGELTTRHLKRGDLRPGPADILLGEPVDRQLLDPELLADAQHVEARLDSRGIALIPWEPADLGPPAIAIGHDAEMPREASELQLFHCRSPTGEVGGGALGGGGHPGKLAAVSAHAEGSAVRPVTSAMISQ